MLNKLRKREQFVALNKTAVKIVTKGIVVQAKPNNLNFTRFGFTATKKLGNAVIRNRAKRRLRAIAQTVSKDINPIGYDFVFIARTHTLTREFTGLLKDAKYAVYTTLTNKN